MLYNKLLLTENRAILRRIYLDSPLHTEQTVTLDTTTFHYVCRVLRCRVGDTLCLFNGDGNDYVATLQVVSKKNAEVNIHKMQVNHRESPLHTTLLQGLCKGERMDVTIQKAVELGVNAIYPVKSDFCAVKLDGERLQKKYRHWQSVMIAACEQCERAVVPTLHPLQALTEVLPTIQAQYRWVLHPYPSKTASTNISGTDAVNSLAILVGPEGGLSDDEVHVAVQQGFEAKCLGKRILRTETAGMAALSVAQYLWGDWRV